MKILHIIPSYVPAHFASGPITPTHYLNKELVRLGEDVTVYTTDMDASNRMKVPPGKEVLVDGVKVFYFKATNPTSWFYSPDMKDAIRDNIKNFDIVHITSVFLSASTVGSYYAKKHKIPYIISPHGSFMRGPLENHSFKKKLYIKLIEKRNLTSASTLHFVAETEKEDYLKTCLPIKKSLVIPNGLSGKEFNTQGLTREDFRRKYKIPSENKIILFLARIHPIKGLDSLVPAIALMAKERKDFTLVLAGYDEGGYSTKIKALINANGLSDKIIFTGPLSGNDKVSALLGSDIFVLPSYSEACSMSLIEAMHFGLPSVITNGVGYSNMINDFGAGIRVEKNETEISHALLKLSGNDNLRKEMGDRARHLAKEEFSIERVAEKFIQAYNSIING